VATLVGMSPYITHGFVTLADVLAGVATRHALDVQHKFVFELGRRKYFRHVWRHGGEAILRSLHKGPLPDDAYARALPADLSQASAGVPVVDEAVRALCATGTLHNHARMWLASHVVHVREVHWPAGADWLYGHLLGGGAARLTGQVIAGANHALAPSVPESGASSRALLLWDRTMLGVVVLRWALVLTVAQECFVVTVMQGPAYVADAPPSG
jgi:hypothetical protein